MFGNLGAKKKKVKKAAPPVPLDMGTPSPIMQQDSGGASYTGLIAGGILIVGIVGVLLYWKK